MSPKGKLVHELFDQLNQKLDQGIKKSKERFRLLNASINQATSATKESYEKLAKENQKLHADYEKQVKKIQKEIKDSETSAIQQKIELLNNLHQEYLLVIDQVRLSPLQELQTFKLGPLLSQLQEYALTSYNDTVDSLSEPIYNMLNHYLKRIVDQVQQADSALENYLNQDVWSSQTLTASLEKLEQMMLAALNHFKAQILNTLGQVVDAQDIKALIKDLAQETKNSKTMQAQKESELKALETSLHDDLTTHQNALTDLRRETYQRLSEPLQSTLESESQDVARLQAQLKELQVSVTEATQTNVQKTLLKRYDKLLKIYRKTATGQLEYTVEKQLKKSVSEFKAYVLKRQQKYAEERLNLINAQVKANLQSRLNRYHATLTTHHSNNNETITIVKTVLSYMDAYAHELLPVFDNVYSLEHSLTNTVQSYANLKHTLKDKFLSDVQTTLVLLRKELALKSSLLLQQSLQSEIFYDKVSHQLQLEISKIKHHSNVVRETQGALALKAANIKANLEHRFQAKATVLRLENYLSRIEKEQQIHQQKLDMIHAFESNLIKAKTLRVKSDYHQQSESLELEIVRQIEMLEAQMELAQEEHASRIQTIEEDHQQEMNLINENIQQVEQSYLKRLDALATTAANEKQALEIAMHNSNDKKARKKLRKQIDEVALVLKAQSKAVTQEMSTDYDLNFYRNKLSLVKAELEVQLKDAQDYYSQEKDMLSGLLTEAKDKLNLLTKPTSSKQNIEKLESENTALLDQRLRSQLVTSHQQWEKMIKVPQEKLHQARQEYDQLLEHAKQSNPDLTQIKQRLEPEFENIKQSLKTSYEKELKAKHDALIKHQNAHQALFTELEKIQFSAMPSIKPKISKMKSAVAPQSTAFQGRLEAALEKEKQLINDQILTIEKENTQSSTLLKSLEKNQSKWLQASIKNS